MPGLSQNGGLRSAVFFRGAAWLILAVMAPAPAADGAGLAADLAACRAFSDDRERLACYDKVTATLAADPPPPVIQPAEGAAGPATAAPLPVLPTPEDLFGRDALQAEQIVRESVGVGQVDSLHLRVSAVDQDALGRLVLTFDNGQVWNQIDSPTPRISVGEEVEIRRAALGSYLLVRATGGRGIRVRRRQ